MTESKYIRLNNLARLHRDMKERSIRQQKFSYRIDTRLHFEVLFSDMQTPYSLAMTAKADNIFLLFTVSDNYNIDLSTINRQIKKIANALRLDGKTGPPFSIFLFMVEFDKHIPTTASNDRRPTNKEICEIRRDLPDLHKCYFWHWTMNEPLGKKVRNLCKTRELLGEEAEDFSRKENISSCWTADIKLAKDWKKATIKK